MSKKEIGVPLDRKNLNNHNSNYTELYKNIDKVKGSVDDLVLESGGDSNLEVVQARGGESTLNDRLDKTTQQLADKADKTDVVIKGKGTLNDFDEATRQAILENNEIDINYVLGKGNVKTDNYADNSVSPEKTTFFKQTVNLFNGEFKEGRVYAETDVSKSRYTFGLARGATAIIPIEPNEDYTVKIHDPGYQQLLILGVINEYPIINGAFRDIDSNNYSTYPTLQHTFKNTDEGKYLLVTVSTTTNDIRKLQVERGRTASPYVPHEVIPKDKLDISAIKSHESANSYWKNGIDTGALPNSKKSIDDRELIELVSMGSSGFVTTGGVSAKTTTLTKIDNMGLKFFGVDTVVYHPVDNSKLGKFHTVGAWIYIRTEDMQRSPSFTVKLETSKTDIQFDTRTDLVYDGNELSAGWNLIRFSIGEKVEAVSEIGIVNRVVLACYSDSTYTQVTLGGLWVEKYKKAKVLFIHDGSYTDFFNESKHGYRDLKDRNIPVTIATIPEYIFSDTPSGSFISPSRLYELSIENNNDVSLHSYDADETLSTMTPEEIYEESWNAVSLLRKHGYNPLFRSAFYRNNAPNAYAAKGLFEAFAFHSGKGMQSNSRIESFPFTGRYNVRRIVMHNKSNERIDRDFSNLEKVNGVMVCYTHNVKDDTLSQINIEQWNHFLSRLDEGIEDGRLECVTYPMLKDGIVDTVEYFD